MKITSKGRDSLYDNRMFASLVVSSDSLAKGETFTLLQMGKRHQYDAKNLSVRNQYIYMKNYFPRFQLYAYVRLWTPRYWIL